MANKKNVKGLDVGTSRIVVARHGEDGHEFEQQLNAFVQIPHSRITVSMLKKKGIPHRVGRRRLLYLRERLGAVRQYGGRPLAAADGQRFTEPRRTEKPRDDRGSAHEDVRRGGIGRKGLFQRPGGAGGAGPTT